MSLGPLRLSVESRLAAVLGIPAIVLQYEVGLNRSTFSATIPKRASRPTKTRSFPSSGSSPVALQQQLLRYMDGSASLRLHWDISDVRVLQEDESRKVQRWLDLLRAGAVSVAEVRETLGLEVADADHVYLRPLGLETVPVGELPQSMMPAAPGGRADADEPYGACPGWSSGGKPRGVWH